MLAYANINMFMLEHRRQGPARRGEWKISNLAVASEWSGELGSIFIEIIDNTSHCTAAAHCSPFTMSG